MDKSIHSREYETFLNVLRRVRRETSLTQDELARQLGQTQSFVSKCERGERRIDIVELRAFCRVLGMPLGEFVQLVETILDEDTK